MALRVLVADQFEAGGLDELRTAGFEVKYEPALKDAALREAVASSRCNILIVRGTEVPRDAIEASEELGLIIRAGAGYNTIDVAAASGRSIAVANCPGKNAVAVAELTFGLILALDRRIVDATVDLRAGTWNKKEYSKARGLKGRTLGVIGTGEIGRAVIARARAFEMNVVAYSRSLTHDDATRLGVIRCGSPAEAAARCDILTVHVAAAPETRNLISAEVIEQLRPGAYLINTARADVLDYSALLDAIRDRQIRAGLDVFPKEPGVGQAEFHPEIIRAGGVVYATHHIGASTDEAQQAIADEAVRIAKVFAATGEVLHCVNIETRCNAACQLVVRHYDKVGVLASVLDVISRANISVKQMSNTIYQGYEAALAIIQLDKTPASTLIEAIAGMKDKVIKVEVKPLAGPAGP
ncbi:MAG: hydroxyacid dehydrogenase [Phycisphaerae bacterium]|nr:hydroxyacid dehydrogenase [Phycisphaerae bacterium]